MDHGLVEDEEAEVVRGADINPGVADVEDEEAKVKKGAGVNSTAANVKSEDTANSGNGGNSTGCAKVGEGPGAIALAASECNAESSKPAFIVPSSSIAAWYSRRSCCIRSSHWTDSAKIRVLMLSTGEVGRSMAPS